VNEVGKEKTQDKIEADKRDNIVGDADFPLRSDMRKKVKEKIWEKRDTGIFL
jgi:hypothetical protein